MLSITRHSQVLKDNACWWAYAQSESLSGGFVYSFFVVSSCSVYHTFWPFGRIMCYVGIRGSRKSGTTSKYLLRKLLTFMSWTTMGNPPIRSNIKVIITTVKMIANKHIFSSTDISSISLMERQSNQHASISYHIWPRFRNKGRLDIVLNKLKN